MLAVCGSTHPTTPQAVGTTGSEIFIARYKLYETTRTKIFLFFYIYFIYTACVVFCLSRNPQSLCCERAGYCEKCVCVASKLSYAASRWLQVTSETKDFTGCVINAGVVAGRGLNSTHNYYAASSSLETRVEIYTNRIIWLELECMRYEFIFLHTTRVSYELSYDASLVLVVRLANKNIFVCSRQGSNLRPLAY